ncbi:MAG: flavin reductase family protein [Flavobacteriales bacterium]|nr:flavin reductase family protein [Flavobacteriales bacterium]
MIKSIDPAKVEISEVYGIATAAVSPRPIAFVSSINDKGEVNLSPFSFFNVFSVNPLVLVFSTVRRMRDNTTKDTFNNVKQHAEVVINIVNHDMVEQMSLSSTEYAEGVNEFVKAGFTELKSDLVKPPRVKEAPVSFECKVTEVKELGTEGGAGALIICEAVRIHLNDEILDESGKIDPNKIDAVARMGGDFYCRASNDSIFEIGKPTRIKGVGVDALPDHAKNSKLLTGNDLGKLGGLDVVPTEAEVGAFVMDDSIIQLMSEETNEVLEEKIHELAQQLIKQNELKKAWLTLLQIA